MGIMSYYPPYWALPTRLLSERAAAASFGFINLIANLGGFAGPYAVGFLTDRTGTYVAGVMLLVATAILSGIVLMSCRIPCPRPRMSQSNLLPSNDPLTRFSIAPILKR